MDEQKELLIPMLLSAFFGGSTASLAAVKRKVSVGQALIAVGFSSILSASLPWALMACGLHWGLSALLGAIIGLVIFGLLATADKVSDDLPKTDWIKYIPIPRFPPATPGPQAPQPPQPPKNDQPSGQ